MWIKAIPPLAALLIFAGVFLGLSLGGDDVGIPRLAVIALNIVLWMVLGPMVGKDIGESPQKRRVALGVLVGSMLVYGASAAVGVAAATAAPSNPAVDEQP